MLTSSVCPFSTNSVAPVCASQTRTVSSSLAVAMRWLSGDHAIPQIYSQRVRTIRGNKNRSYNAKMSFQSQKHFHRCRVPDKQCATKITRSAFASIRGQGNAGNLKMVSVQTLFLLYITVCCLPPQHDPSSDPFPLHFHNAARPRLYRSSLWPTRSCRAKMTDPKPTNKPSYAACDFNIA